MEKLRASHRVFDGGADVWGINTFDDGVLGVGRYHKGEKLVALFNFTDQEKHAAVDELGDYHDLRTGDHADKNWITLPSGGFKWLICDFGRTE